jgi:hypothetical protein
MLYLPTMLLFAHVYNCVSMGTDIVIDRFSRIESSLLLCFKKSSLNVSFFYLSNHMRTLGDQIVLEMGNVYAYVP